MRARLTRRTLATGSLAPPARGVARGAVLSLPAA